ncbi:MAG: dipeptide ABC transporter ATP-binding protein [Alkalilacustris sp.]
MLTVDNLTVDIPVPAGTLRAVRGIDFSLQRGETLCIVGESGSGKSLTSLALMGLLPPTARRMADRLRFGDHDLSALSEARMSDLRGNRMAMIFQEPMTSLNPVFTVGDQLEEALLRHERVGRRAARDRALYLLERVGIPAPRSRLSQYPHQLSGGLRQRVMIAMALMCGPDLLIADEPTTALDVSIQAQILALLRELQDEFGMGIILITHDLSVVARVADRVAVMYAGQFVETAAAAEIFHNPRHPYTQGLMQCIPTPGKTPPGARLGAIRGVVPSLVGGLDGCAFANRCPFARAQCRSGAIAMADVGAGHRSRCILSPAEAAANAETPAAWDAAPETGGPTVPGTVTAPALPEPGQPLLTLEGVSKTFSVKRGFFGVGRPLHAVSDVSLELREGEVLGLVGESGCGKSTLSKLLLGLLDPSAGRVLFEGKPLLGHGRRYIARHIQPVFQDPYSSLNPRKSVGFIIGQPLRVHGEAGAAETSARVRELLDMVGLPQRVMNAYPSQLSGGQRQRVAIARALILKPKVIICDEPTSALDVSVQSQILNLLLDLQRELGLSYLLVSHNLAVVQHMAHRVAVMYLGRLVEVTDSAGLFQGARHPYTRALLDSALTPDPEAGVPAPRLGATPPDPMNPPEGCAFNPRCPEVMDVCRLRRPRQLVDATGRVECHLHGEGADPARLRA